MQTRNHYFSELNLTKLKDFAGEWADWYPAINKILLFKEKPLRDEYSKYILVAIVPSYPNEKILKIKAEYGEERKKFRQQAEKLTQERVLGEIEKAKRRKEEKLESLSEEEKMAIRACSWSNTDCLHIQRELAEVYMGKIPQEIIGRWMWLNIYNFRIEQTDIVDMIKPESKIVLFEKFHEDQAPQERREQAEAGSKLPFEHSPDFRSINKNGVKFTLTPKQTQVIEMLFNEFEKGTFDLGQGYIIEKVSPYTSTTRLRDIFKGNIEAWKALIKPGNKKGTFRLNI